MIDKEKSTFENIVFKKIALKKKEDRPHSWEEYLELNLNTGFDGCGIDFNMSGGVQTTGLHHRGKAIVPNNLAAPFIAMMQLMSIRASWVDSWDENTAEEKWGIAVYKNKFRAEVFLDFHYALSFPTQEMAEDFLETFRDLLEKAKRLI